MRVHALGVYRMNGVGKKSGNAYDMAKLVIQVPVEVVANQNMKRVGFGYGSKELDLEVEALSKFGQFQFPCDLELEIGSRISPFGLEAVVTGAKAALKAAA